MNNSYGYHKDPPVFIDDSLHTYGDYLERCNVPNAELVHRCGICEKPFNTAEELVAHHKKSKETPYKYHKPVRTAGGLSYLVDAEGYRVTSRGWRIDE